ncbi:MAG: hypothetical protein ABIA78_02190 [archaeon]
MVKQKKEKISFNFFPENRRGWIRIVEAFVAVLLIAGVVLILIDKKGLEQQDISVDIYEMELSVLREIELDDSLRNSVLDIEEIPLSVWWEDANFPENIKSKIEEKTHAYDCKAKICALGEDCEIEGDVEGVEIYVQSVAITSNLEKFSPRQLKMFCLVEDGIACLPDCAGKECGSDGCGGICNPGCSEGDICAMGLPVELIYEEFTNLNNWAPLPSAYYWNQIGCNPPGCAHGANFDPAELELIPSFDLSSATSAKIIFDYREGLGTLETDDCLDCNLFDGSLWSQDINIFCDDIGTTYLPMEIDIPTKYLNNNFKFKFRGEGFEGYSEDVYIDNFKITKTLDGVCCTPDCAGKECGDDGCRGYCLPYENDCGAEKSCSLGTCVCEGTLNDCDNDGSCECDINTYKCFERSCVIKSEGYILLEDGFEERDWDAKWDANGITDWSLNSDEKSGSHSAVNIGNNDDDDLISDDLDASDANEIRIFFWYKKDDIENSDFWVELFNGNQYIQIQDIDIYEGPDNCIGDYGDDKWCRFDKIISDSQYFKNNFRLKFEGSGTDYGSRHNDEWVWIDDVKITKTI